MEKKKGASYPDIVHQVTQKLNITEGGTTMKFKKEELKSLISDVTLLWMGSQTVRSWQALLLVDGQLKYAFGMCDVAEWDSDSSPDAKVDW